MVDLRTPEVVAMEREISASIRRVLLRLKPRLRTVLELRHGFDDNGGSTYAEIAQVIGVSPSRARDLEYQAYRHIRLNIASSKDVAVLRASV